MTLARTKLTASRDGMLRLEVLDDVPTRQARPATFPPRAIDSSTHPVCVDGCRVGRPTPMATASHRFELEVGSCNTLRFRAVRHRVSAGAGALRPATRDVAMGFLIVLAALGAWLA